MKLTAITLALLASASYGYADQAPEDCSALRDTVFDGGHVTSARGQAARSCAISPRACASPIGPSLRAASAHSSRMRADQSGS